MTGADSKPHVVPPGGHEVALTIDGGDWLGALADAAGLARAAAHAALATQPALDCAEVSLVLADDALLRRLNRDHRGIDSPTNVLAFPGCDFAAAAPPPRAPHPLLLGDVVIGFETAASEAKDAGKPLADHLAHLVVHGVLHLLGHDHAIAADADAMEALETRVLAGLGIADPYAPALAHAGPVGRS